MEAVAEQKPSQRKSDSPSLLARIEAEIRLLTTADTQSKIHWQSLGQLLLDSRKQASWQQVENQILDRQGNGAGSFTEWIRRLSTRSGIGRSKLWQYLSNAEFYAAQRAADPALPSLDDEANNHLSETLETIQRIARVEPDDNQVRELIRRAQLPPGSENALSKRKAVELWKTLQQAAPDVHARGRVNQLRHGKVVLPAEKLLASRIAQAIDAWANREFAGLWRMVQDVPFVQGQTIPYIGVQLKPGEALPALHLIEIATTQDELASALQRLPSTATAGESAWLIVPAELAARDLAKTDAAITFGLASWHDGALQTVRKAPGHAPDPQARLVIGLALTGMLAFPQATGNRQVSLPAVAEREPEAAASPTRLAEPLPVTESAPAPAPVDSKPHRKSKRKEPEPISIPAEQLLAPDDQPVTETPAAAVPAPARGGKKPDFKQTDEQLAIIEANEESLIIKALAGSGKTTTLLQRAARYPEQDFLYLAFNKEAETDATRRIDQMLRAGTLPKKNIIAKTTHAFALNQAPVRKMVNGRELRGDYRILELIPLLKLEKFNLPDKETRLLARSVRDTLKMFCQSADLTLDARHVRNVVETNGVLQLALDNDILHIARQIWQMSIDPAGRLGVTHDVYLKYFQTLKMDLGDRVVLLDEAQDCTPCQSDIVLSHSGRRIVVGDSYQQIYAWRGAVDALEQMHGHGKEYMLTGSFRFGPEIAEKANQILSLLGAGGVRGLGPKQDPHMIQQAFVSRGNAVLFREAMSCVGRGEPFWMRLQMDAFYKYIDVARLFHKRSPRKGGPHEDLVPFSTFDELEQHLKVESDRDLQLAVKLAKDIPDFEERLWEVKENLEGRKQPQPHERVLTTAHRAKGSEYGTVEIAHDFPQLANKVNGKLVPADVDEEEINIAYVAVTRGINQVVGDKVFFTSKWGKSRGKDDEGDKYDMLFDGTSEYDLLDS